MNLSRLLEKRAAADQPIRVALIGCGKFSTMYLTQARITPGIHILGIAELNHERARGNLAKAGWPAEQYGAADLADALKNGTTLLTDSLAWGDQPALICEHIDWARSCGFEVTSAGKGTRYLPDYHALTPDTVWDVLKQYLEIEDPNSINLQMFNSFLDGSKSAIEMTAVCNAMRLVPQADGLAFPPASRFELADICKPASHGGSLSRAGTTEVVSSLTREGETIEHHLAMGTFVVVRPTTDYARQCFKEYHMLPDASGEYGALYRPTHMIGLELGVSVASAALRAEPTGSPVCFSSDVVAVAKRDLKAGEMLDGEGAVQTLGDTPIHLLINNAGIFKSKPTELDTLDESTWVDEFRVNAISPLMVTRALKSNLAAAGSSVVGMMSSKMGSMGDNTSGGDYSYRSSKAALNAVSVSLAKDLAKLGISVIAMHPGWVQTDMGGPNALIDSVRAMTS
ncbi:MAG: SDR family NAD(P)-dependent oxidoreductase [Gammaproteobacteria bacterium]|nr:SDR family NAD(P)-dependent oxidoreductase [Gammaproteobacteria bacterium]